MKGNRETVNIVMAVYNEERTVAEIMNRVLAQKVVDRLIVINDDSSDLCLAIIKRIAKEDRRVSYMSNSSNMGKGYSVRRGIKSVKDGIIIIQDADLEYYPEDYAKLLPRLKDDTIVLGTRVRTKQTGQNYIVARFVNACLTTEFNTLYGTSLTDINTCYKVFKKKMLDGAELRENGFLIDIEILISLVKKGYKVAEVDIRYKGRTYKEGKKITAKDALQQVSFMIEKKMD